MSEDVVAKTIESYEALAGDHHTEHLEDINEIKCHADFFISNLKGKRVLDVGSGPGRDAKYFASHGLNVAGIDLSQKLITLAAKNVPAARFIKMDMRKLEFPESTFDGIWACASFLHIPKKEASSTLLEFRRVLRPGGLLFIAVKEGAGEGWMEKEGRPRFFALYTEDELGGLIESCGFRILDVIGEKKKSMWLNFFAIKQ